MYLRGIYNKFDEKEQWIRITDGCPNKCEYCYCPEDLEFYGIPEIVRRDVKIMDMNLLCQPNVKEIIEELGNKRVDGKVVYYELVCGIDWRFLTPEIAQLLKKNRFVKMRFAWDHSLKQQIKIKEAITILVNQGYKAEEISVFIIANWKVSYQDCLFKLDLCKVWNVKVNECWFDNQKSPNIKPIHCTEQEIKDFRRKCRDHNHMVRFRLYHKILPKYIVKKTKEQTKLQKW